MTSLHSPATFFCAESHPRGWLNFSKNAPLTSGRLYRIAHRRVARLCLVVRVRLERMPSASCGIEHQFWSQLRKRPSPSSIWLRAFSICASSHRPRRFGSLSYASANIEAQRDRCRSRTISLNRVQANPSLRTRELGRPCSNEARKTTTASWAVPKRSASACRSRSVIVVETASWRLM